MKKLYYNSKNIKAKSKKILSFLNDNIKIRNIDFSLNRSALIILDMQQYFLSSKSHAFIPSSKSIIPNINKLIKLYEKNNLPIIFTRHINNSENAGMMGKWWKDLIEESSILSSINKKINVANHKVINKTQYDAFYKTELKDFLNESNVKQLVVTGVMTHLCCETTIRSAFVNGFEVFFPIDSTADYNIKFHKASLLNLSHGFATPVLTDDLLKISEME